MPWWTWTALVVFAVVAGAGALVTVAALVQMKRLRGTGEDVAGSLEELSAKTEALQARLQQSEARAKLVEQKLTQLNRSFERLSVLTWAIGDAKRVVSGVTDAVTLRK